MRFIKLAVTMIAVTVCVTAKPFLYNASQALSFVVTSASNPQQRTNVADLRKSKLQQQEKESYDQSPFDENQAANESFHNQALPGIVQKKIEKILAKLQFLASLSNQNKYDDSDDDKGDEQTVVTTTEEQTIFINNNDTLLIADDSIAESELKEFENFRDLGEDSPQVQRPSFTLLTLPRILGSLVRLTYKMFSISRNKST